MPSSISSGFAGHELTHGAVTVKGRFASVSSHELMLSPVATAGDIVNVSCVPGGISDRTLKP